MLFDIDNIYVDARTCLIKLYKRQKFITNIKNLLSNLQAVIKSQVHSYLQITRDNCVLSFEGRRSL